MSCRSSTVVLVFVNPPKRLVRIYDTERHYLSIQSRVFLDFRRRFAIAVDSAGLAAQIRGADSFDTFFGADCPAVCREESRRIDLNRIDFGLNRTLE